MNIPMWSNHKKAGVTSNITAIAIMGVLETRYNVTLIENHKNEKDLSSRILYDFNSDLIKETEFYYLGRGISDCLVRQMSKMTNKKHTDYERLEIIENRLYYIPQSPVINKLFELDFKNYQLPLIRKLSNSENMVMIDTECNYNISSIEILNEAELVVVNLKQSTLCVYDFFHNYSSLADKAVFIISRYHYKRGEAVKRALRKHGVDSERIAVVPDNDEFYAAMGEGRSVEFITSHYKCSRKDPNYRFIKEVKNAVHMIVKHAEMQSKRVEL